MGSGAPGGSRGGRLGASGPGTNHDGSVTGVVVDAQGGVVPGATVVLISETQGTRMAPVVTNAGGSYTVPNVKADTYSVEVSMPSFKPLTRKGVKVSGGDRVPVEALTLQIGGQTETVTVQAEAPGHSSRERRTLGRHREQSSSRTCRAGPATTSPSSSPSCLASAAATKIGGSGQTNYMIDGISAMDTGNNGLMGGLTLPIDQVAEVKVITRGITRNTGARLACRCPR